MTDHKCNRCGAELKVVEVLVPIPPVDPIPHDMIIDDFFKAVRYETREDVADCPRCTGGY